MRVKVINKRPASVLQMKRVCAYARVSTDSRRQEDLTDIKSAYDLKTITFAVMPGVGIGNNHKGISYIDKAEIKVSDNKYTFEVPSEDAVIAIYGETGTKTYRFKDIIVE